ncbi:hypothetical protein I302_104613 [Kwoniella bestiolae CBS 10118]|uniref:Uncharacterized protein n=1 Tax=Kwoniella bestiolae CBS 10118 TaxID=1296100 RepID=A0A1B9GBQ9_9TREE|nr:hypothetical protein I302_03320 [Kwoniella bestiolae CBS 10118]OCF28461.1 hypothetical protein I302_03320 [Kwoniella bestiolae CBS 10118]
MTVSQSAPSSQGIATPTSTVGEEPTSASVSQAIATNVASQLRDMAITLREIKSYLMEATLWLRRPSSRSQISKRIIIALSIYLAERDPGLAESMKRDVLREYEKEVTKAFDERSQGLSLSTVRNWYSNVEGSDGWRPCEVWNELKNSNITVTPTNENRSAFRCEYGPDGENRQMIEFEGIGFHSDGVTKSLDKYSPQFR